MYTQTIELDKSDVRVSFTLTEEKLGDNFSHLSVREKILAVVALVNQAVSQGQKSGEVNLGSVACSRIMYGKGGRATVNVNATAKWVVHLPWWHKDNAEWWKVPIASA